VRVPRDVTDHEWRDLTVWYYWLRNAA
jgi:hypothetical protein